MSAITPSGAIADKFSIFSIDYFNYYFIFFDESYGKILTDYRKSLSLSSHEKNSP